MRTIPDETEGMEDLYSGESESAAQEAAESPEKEQQEQEHGLEAVAPMKVLQGPGGEPLKEGDEVVVKITGVHGDEVTFAYSNTKPSEIGGEEGYTREKANTELDALDKGEY